MKIHIVQKGDTLWKLAKKYGVSFDELKKINSQLSNPDLLMPGMKLKIPGTASSMKKEVVQSKKETKEFPLQSLISGVKEQHIVKEQPIVKEHIVKEQPIVKEHPIVKEQPIVKEKPIVPPAPVIIEKEIVKEKPIYITKEVPIPQPVIPQADINNYYMLNLANVDVTEAPKPVKEKKLPKPPKAPKPSKPLKMPETPPVVQAPAVEVPIPVVEQPMEECIPVTPILPGSGFCYPPPPPLPLQYGSTTVDCGTVDYVPTHVPAPNTAPISANVPMPVSQANVESSDIWGESSIQAPVGPGNVAGVSAAYVPNPYPTTYPNLAPTPNPAYSGALPYVQPAPPVKSKDCGCGKTDLGTYGPEKTTHTMQSLSSNITSSQPYQPGLGAQPYYQNPQPGLGAQPYYQSPQPGLGAQPYYQSPQPGLGAQPYYQSPQPGLRAQPYYQNSQPGLGVQSKSSPPISLSHQPSPYTSGSFAQPQTLPAQFGGQPGPFNPEQYGGVRAPETFGMPTFAEESDDF